MKVMSHLGAARVVNVTVAAIPSASGTNRTHPSTSAHKEAISRFSHHWQISRSQYSCMLRLEPNRGKSAWMNHYLRYIVFAAKASKVTAKWRKRPHPWGLSPLIGRMSTKWNIPRYNIGKMTCSAWWQDDGGCDEFPGRFGLNLRIPPSEWPL